jgi:hypothetical protein
VVDAFAVTMEMVFNIINNYVIEWWMARPGISLLE